jgi:RNA polymerase sigma factor (sigma-70 family)
MSAEPLTDKNLFWTESLAGELRGFLTMRVKCSEAAAELTHDTYLGLKQVVEQNPPDNLRAMAFRIAVNLAIDYQRKTTVRNRHAANEDFESITEYAFCPTSQPDKILIGQERLKTLQKALNELPAITRTVFLLHGSEGLTYSEIALQLGISKSLVNKLLAQAMHYCAEQLD